MSAARRKGSSTPGFEELVREDLKTGKFRPVYVLSGEDTLRKEGVVEHLKKTVLGEAGAAFNFHVYNADESALGPILQQALSYPMLGSHQLIWAKNIDAAVGGAADQAKLEEYIQKPIPETVLILTAAKVDKRKKWVKKAIESGYFFDFTPPAGEALVQWVMKAARREQLELPDEAARTLCDLVGNDLMSLKSEIDKLALLQEDRGGQLDATEIASIIMDQAALEGYEITTHLEPGHAREVMKTWFRLTQWGKSAYEIAPLLLARLRTGALVARGRQAGLRNEDIARLGGLNAWSLRYLEPMIRGFGEEGAVEMLKTALECDRTMKSSPIPPELALERTILECCRKR